MASTSRNKRGRRIIGGVLTVLSLFFVVIFFVSVGEVVLVKYVNPPFTFSMLRGWVHQKTGTRYYRSPSYQCVISMIFPPIFVKQCLPEKISGFYVIAGLI